MDNRSNILNCAMKLFAARGYEAVGVQEIVDMAGITKPTLYHYFGSKLGLLNAILSEYFVPFCERVQQACAYHGDLPSGLHRVVLTHFQFAEQNPDFYRLQLSLWFAPRESEAFEVVFGYLEKLYQPIETLFYEAVQDHGNMRNRQQQYAISLQGVINTYIGLALNGFIKLDDKWVDKVVHQFSHGIYS
jgi:AcrR family transcriptional regulator